MPVTQPTVLVHKVIIQYNIIHVKLYEGRSINKLQNGIILLIFNIYIKSEINVL